MRRVLLFLLLSVAVLALAGCQIDATVAVRMRSDGSGAVVATVRLDADAVARAEVGGGKLEDRIRLTDLAASGWHVGPWRRTAQGASIQLEKPFTRPKAVTSIVAELNGANGPLRGFRATRDASALSVKWRVDGTVDLRNVGTHLTDDAELVARLRAQQVDPAVVQSALDADLRAALRVGATASVPGSSAAVTAKPGQVRVLHLRADRSDRTRVALLVAAVVIGFLGLALLVAGEIRVLRRRAGRRSRASELP
ncbi:MAG: hypothetical protein JWL73_2124 [Actinomycetia bacterium]|nr:hypothetical protein [Actinomycetes bacterium]